MYIVRLLVLLGLIALGVNGITSQRQVLITYPTDTPLSELDSYKEVITAAGGQILHEFKLIKGFIIKASKETLATVNTLSEKYPPTIEDDKTVTAQGQGL